MFALGCLKFIKHSLQNSRQLLYEMKPSRLFWVQMICCCSTVKVSGSLWERVWLVTPGDISSQAMGDCWLIPGLLAPSSGECDAQDVPCYSPRVLELDRTKAEVGFAHTCQVWTAQHLVLGEMHSLCWAILRVSCLLQAAPAVVSVYFLKLVLCKAPVLNQ